jgi:hypothetical protein
MSRKKLLKQMHQKMFLEENGLFSPGMVFNALLEILIIFILEADRLACYWGTDSPTTAVVPCQKVRRMTLRDFTGNK